ncbi:GntR family transcriptional regulator [Candidatus Poribacteria bacterium]|nr:GntR family transcriptional regulator [Candidatus Poribacteria bacterium]
MSDSLQISIDLADTTKPVYQQIADAIRVWLVRGELKRGEQLPTVRELAAELGVHHNTVAESYRRLAAEGWLELRRRHGATVLEKDTSAQAKTESRDRFFNRLQQLLAQGRAEGVQTKEIINMTRRILSG